MADISLMCSRLRWLCLQLDLACFFDWCFPLMAKRDDCHFLRTPLESVNSVRNIEVTAPV